MISFVLHYLHDFHLIHKNPNCAIFGNFMKVLIIKGPTYIRFRCQDKVSMITGFLEHSKSESWNVLTQMYFLMIEYSMEDRQVTHLVEQ